MAKQTETTAPAAKRETRVAFSGSDMAMRVTFKLPGGAESEHAVFDFPQSTREHALQYGLRRLYQDGLAGAIKDGADADEAAQGLIDRFQSGDFSRSRSGGGISLQSVARDMVTKALRTALGKAPDAETVKAKVALVLDAEGNPKGYAKVLAEFERQKALTVDADDLGI